MQSIYHTVLLTNSLPAQPSMYVTYQTLLVLADIVIECSFYLIHTLRALEFNVDVLSLSCCCQHYVQRTSAHPGVLSVQSHLPPGCVWVGVWLCV